MSIPTRRSSDEPVCDRQQRTSQCGFHLSESHTHSQARPSRPVAAQTNTAIPIEPAMITHTSGELLSFRTMSPSPTSDLLEPLLVPCGLSLWYA
jgi:hypothetical protein